MKPDPSTTLERVSAVHRSEHPRYGTRDYKAVMFRIILPKVVRGCALYAGTPAGLGALTVTWVCDVGASECFPAVGEPHASMPRRFRLFLRSVRPPPVAAGGRGVAQRGSRPPKTPPKPLPSIGYTGNLYIIPIL